MPSDRKEQVSGYTPMSLEGNEMDGRGGYLPCRPNVFRESSEVDYEAVFPADQDLMSPVSSKQSPMPSYPSRSRTASTADRMKEGSPARGYRFRLRTRSDVQEAVVFLEGEEAQDDGPQDPEIAGDSRGFLLPASLSSSFVLGATCMLTVQRQCVHDNLGSVNAIVFTVSFLLVVLSALVCMAFAALVDPGQLLYDVVPAPKRSHKSFQYNRPLMRYDHYCRWIMNSIALKNHREFVIMLVCFCISIIFDIVVDVISIYWSASQANAAYTVIIVLHLGYSMVFAYLVVPILRLHLGFISRNELANEWKRDLYYIVHDSRTGKPVWVKELDAEDFNDLFDAFQYDSSRNPWDQGCPTNCWNFWFTPRWQQENFGEF